MCYRTVSALILIAAVLGSPEIGTACTAFGLQRDAHVLMGRNFDWYRDDGVLVTNPRRAKKTAMIAMETNQPGVQWVSQYGSITLNQIAPDRPLGGINEAGLAVAGLLLRQTRYPNPDSRPAIAQAQWIQYQLDNHNRIEQVIASDAHMRIFDPKGMFGIHYLACDASGACAAIDFVDGKMVTHTGTTLPAPTLTNHPYEDSATYLRRFAGFGGTRSMPTDIDSMDRFVRASMLLRAYEDNAAHPPVDYAFQILQTTQQGRVTRWSIVYDLSRRRIYFKTQRNPAIRFVDLKHFDFSCDRPTRAYDLMANHTGDVSAFFTPYTDAQRHDRVMAVNSLYRFSPSNMDVIIDYPNHVRCTTE